MSAETMVQLSYQNIKRNRPSMRHAFQDTVEDLPQFEPERHQFLRRCDVEGVLPSSFDSHPTGRTRVGVDSPLLKDLSLCTEERVYRIHGEAGFIVS